MISTLSACCTWVLVAELLTHVLSADDGWKTEYVPVPIPVPVYVPVPMHMYSQNVPVPATVPVPVSQTPCCPPLWGLPGVGGTAPGEPESRVVCLSSAVSLGLVASVSDGFVFNQGCVHPWHWSSADICVCLTHIVLYLNSFWKERFVKL